MFSGKNEAMYLPVWRDGRLLFFTNITSPNSTRLSYVAAAATDAGSTIVRRTGRSPLTNDALAHCQKIADAGPELQAFYDSIGGGNLANFTNFQRQDHLPYPDKSNHLIFTCLFLDFLRKYAVDEEIVRLYENTRADRRFNLEKSLGIYKILSARLESERAERILGGDQQYLKTRGQAKLSLANFYRGAAMVKFEVGKYFDAEKLMLQAVKHHDTEDKWRRLGEFAASGGVDNNAIFYYQKAHSITPLKPPSALALAKLLVNNGQFDDAKPFVDIFAKVFPNPAKEIMEKIEKDA